MARPTTHEFALLKLLATSIIFFIEGKYNSTVELCLPYLIEHDSNKEPNILWLPDLDYPFSNYVLNDNKALWNEFHIRGRLRNTDVSIWNFIAEIEKQVSCETPPIYTEIKEGKDLKQANAAEFSVPDLREKIIVLAAVRQSCGTLISVITFMLGGIDGKDHRNLEVDVKKYLEHVRQSRYLMLFQDLNLPSINATIWKAMRIENGANHWGASQVQFAYFSACSKEWCKQLKLDFSGDFNESGRADDSRGRPSLNDILSRDSSNGRIQRVIENRVRSLLGETSKVRWMVGTEVGTHDYLWFNALAVADCFVAAVRGYEELLASNERVIINNYYKAHPFVILHLCFLEDNCLEVQIYEPGLEGAVERFNTGNSLRSMLNPAKIAGADKLILFVKDKAFHVVGGETVEIEEQYKLESPFSNFTGLIFHIQSEFNKKRLVLRETYGV